MTDPSVDLNFYDLLNLDPDAPWNRSEFEKALAEKQGVWSRQAVGGMGDIKRRAAANRTWAATNRERMFNDAAFRDEQAREARAARSAG